MDTRVTTIACQLQIRGNPLTEERIVVIMDGERLIWRSEIFPDLATAQEAFKEIDADLARANIINQKLGV